MAPPPVPPGLQSPASLARPLQFPAASGPGRLPPLFLQNPFESGASGSNITTGNSAGPGANAFDTAQIGASATLQYDSAHALHGGLGCKLATPASAVSAFVAWTTTLGSQTTVWFRASLFFTASPGASFRLFYAFSSGTAAGGFSLNTNGKILGQTGSGSTQITSANTIPLNQPFRLEGFITGSATAGQIEFKLYKSLDATIPDETLTSAAAFSTTGPITEVRFGPQSTASIGPYWQDDVAVSNTGYIGPVGAEPSPAPFATVTPPGLLSPMALARPLQFPGAQAPAAPSASGPPVRPLGHPVQAQRFPQREGRTAARGGAFAQTGPPVRPPSAPVKAQPAVPFLTGRAARRAGAFGGTGPPVRPPQGPVAGKGRGLPPRGRTASRAGTFTGTGPPVTPPRGPVQAKPPVTQPLPRGRIVRTAGTYQGTGAPLVPQRQPVSAARRPLPPRGRAQALRGPYGQTGPPVIAPRRPVRGQPQRPFLAGRTVSRAGRFTAPLPAVLGYGAILAGPAPGGSLAAAPAASGDPGTGTAAAGTLGTGPAAVSGGYPARYGQVYSGIPAPVSGRAGEGPSPGGSAG